MKLPAYPRTKPSGGEWLGDVPEHWESKRFGYLFRFYSGGTPSTSESDLWDGELPWVSSKDMKSMVIADTEDHISEAAVRQSATCKLPAGSLLIVNRSGILKHSIPAAIITREMAINQDIRGCVPLSAVDSKFIAYLIVGNQPALLALWRQQGATVESLTFESVKTTNLHLPNLAEQRAIALFLDRETGRVDRLVAKKRELIERLKEKRTALISRTVTRGLPPAAARAAGLPANPPLKPSGVPWFDEYPRHWQTKRLRHISDIIVVGVVVNPSSYVTDEGVVFLLGGDVREMRIDTTDCKRCSPESSNGALVKSRLDAGDLVVVRVGYPGVAAVVPPELAGGNVASMMLVRRHPRYCSQWLAYAFNSQVGRDQVEIVQYGAAQKQFNISHAVDFAFPFPPLPEQTAIAAYLDEKTAKLDALVGKVAEAVERLQEYRTALITAAVTGKIDVRPAKRVTSASP